MERKSIDSGFILSLKFSQISGIGFAPNTIVREDTDYPAAVFYSTAGPAF